MTQEYFFSTRVGVRGKTRAVRHAPNPPGTGCVERYRNVLGSARYHCVCGDEHRVRRLTYVASWRHVDEAADQLQGVRLLLICCRHFNEQISNCPTPADCLLTIEPQLNHRQAECDAHIQLCHVTFFSRELSIKLIILLGHE